MNEKVRRITELVILSFLGVVGIVGCASIGLPGEPPAWIREPPRGTSGSVVILAYGAGESFESAETAAYRDGADQLAQILLQRFDPEAGGNTPALSTAIDERAHERSRSLTPLDTYRQTRSDEIREVFLLLEYTGAQIATDINRLDNSVDPRTGTIDPERIVESEEPAQPVVSPEAGSEPNVLEQMRELLQAFSTDGTERRGVLEEALALAARVVIEVQPGEMQIPLPQAAPREIAVRIVDRSGTSVPLGNIAVEVEMQFPEVDGHRETRREVIRTNGDGRARFRPEQLDLAGVTRVRFRPDWLPGALIDWVSRSETPEETAALSALDTRLTGTTTIRVTSGAASVPTAIVLIDRDIAGNPIVGRDAARGAFQQMQELGLDVRLVELPPAIEALLAERENLNVEDLYDLLPFDVLASTERVIVGNARIERFDENDGITVVVDMQATAFDLRRDRRLADISFQERATGRDVRSTLRSAFHSAGRRVARRITPRLP